MALLRDHLAELVRESQAMSRRDAAVGALMSVVVLGVAVAALLAPPTDLLGVLAVVVLLCVGLTGVGITLNRLGH